jgi:hypothetical protein
VPDGADVHVRLRPLELGLAHWFLLVAIVPTGGGAKALLGAPFFWLTYVLCGVTHHGPWR